MTNEEKNKIALFKYGIIAPLITNHSHYESNEAFPMIKLRGNIIPE